MDNDNIQITVDRKDIEMLLCASYTTYHFAIDRDIINAIKRIAKASDLSPLVTKMEELLNDTPKS